ncbi:AmmeMemoRadiSam system radical SAM enzyme [Candidatus Shapirobacteria bacterium CG10_big_fil_rev_8_21_14_0_10_40_9]|uniref:AmmeMemoRadiSam system radical SAM enzyme n=1 Tax=Candidatus Shapirobacteria bacterium CG10_big_fil_rev_8_21_14_0_10_40_9 TaxID=1974888 RepID=A0A2M8L4E8_9BACT|nr:MAG: AmmeMemoRadiSam system radical SAM enzyme [Candidatus Shapirobacteria bacterium CG10_big_fil_rev_8_21_14_0_10_40_9]
MVEARLYKKLADKSVRCNLCSHRCLIKPGERGICSVRENQGGTLYSLVYGKVIAANVDPIEKKPLFHFQPGSLSFSIATAGCNFRCEFCQNWQISQITKGPKGEIIGKELPPEQVVQKALETECSSIAYTYTEPTIFFEYAADTAKLAKKKGLANVFVTNGYQTPETIKEMAKFVDAANVDLKSFSEEFYQKICGAKLKPVLEAIKLMHKAGIWLEITTLVVPDQNDSEKELSEIAKFIAGVSKNIPWHISRFHPDFKMTDSYPTPLETLEKAFKIGKKAGLKYVYLGNVATVTRENTYCPKCKNLAIRRVGYDIETLGVDKKGECRKCGQNLNIISE